jgi:carboxyl-terminal processing protease
MRDLLRQVKDEKADGLLLDLSRNGGGLLENSVEIAGFFIRNGGVVAVKDSFSKVQVLRDPDDSLLYDGPMVLLTSRVSASASEIVAGAMKDYRRAIVVGDDHTFGKGTVQSMVQLSTELGALKVTTALFFRPGGASTQHEGVRADIVFPSLYSANELGEKHQDYSLPGQTIDAFLESASSPTPGLSDPAFWRPVTADAVAALADRSAKRIDESQDFADIRKQIEETKGRNGVLHLSDIYKPPSEEAGEEGSEAGDAKQPQDPTQANAGAAGGGLPDDGSVASTAGDSSKTGELAHIPPGTAEPEPDADAKEPTPQQREALQILADWVLLES